MAGTRTAPTVNGTPQFKQISLSVIDYTGDKRTDSYYVDADSSDAEIEAYAAALAAGSNASLYRIRVSDVYNSNPSADNADEDVWEEAKSNVVVLEKAPTIEKGQDWYIPAPVNSMFVEGEENVDPSNGLFIAFLAAITPMRAGYAAVSARFTSRKDVGTKVNL